MDDFDESDETCLRSIARHPPVAFSLKVTVENEEASDVVAHMLVHIQFPNLYPMEEAVPRFKVAYFMVTDKTTICSSNKPLESLAFLDESRLLDAIATEAESLLPYPCVYEIISTWLPENLFSRFVTMKAS